MHIIYIYIYCILVCLFFLFFCYVWLVLFPCDMFYSLLELDFIIYFTLSCITRKQKTSNKILERKNINIKITSLKEKFWKIYRTSLDLQSFFQTEKKKNSSHLFASSSAGQPGTSLGFAGQWRGGGPSRGTDQSVGGHGLRCCGDGCCFGGLWKWRSFFCHVFFFFFFF